MQKIRNWFGNQDRPERKAQKVQVTDDKVNNAGNAVYKRKPRTKPDKKETLPMATTAEQIKGLFARRCAHIPYDVYKTANWKEGLEDRANTNWPKFKSTLPGGTDLTDTRAKYDNAFAALELASLSLDKKKHLRSVYKDVKSENVPEGFNIDEHKHTQQLVDCCKYVTLPVPALLIPNILFTRNQQHLDNTGQTMANILHRNTGMPVAIITGGPDILKSGALSRYV